jgi:3-dehydroquinate synthetase
MEEGITKREDGERLVELCRACLREFERENISDIRSALTSSLLDKKNEDTDEVAVVLMKKIGKWSLVKYPYEKYVEKVVSAYEIWTNAWWNK